MKSGRLFPSRLFFGWLGGKKKLQQLSKKEFSDAYLIIRCTSLVYCGELINRPHYSCG